MDVQGIDLNCLSIMIFSFLRNPYCLALVSSNSPTLSRQILSFFKTSNMEVIYNSVDDFSRFYLFSLWLLTEGHEAEKVPGIGLGKFNMSGILVACCGRVHDERLLLLNPSSGISKSNNELVWLLTVSWIKSLVEHLKILFHYSSGNFHYGGQLPVDGSTVRAVAADLVWTNLTSRHV